jgi:hypothetical protein
MPMAEATKIWTLAELDSLPDDGNTYELLGGALFVTPPPSDYHETIGARLHALLVPGHDDEVEKETLVWHPTGATRALTIGLAEVFGIERS